MPHTAVIAEPVVNVNSAVIGEEELASGLCGFESDKGNRLESDKRNSVRRSCSNKLIVHSCMMQAIDVP